jgi:hypothetical protein
VRSIRLLQDDDTGQISLDISAAQTGIIAAMIALLHGWMACSGRDRDELITLVREVVDENLVDDDTAD